MKLSNIKNIEFWTREYQLPLFWLTDPHHLVLRDNVLILYKNSILHCYFLNDHLQKEAQRGYQYFRQGDSFNKYCQRAQKTIKRLNCLVKDYKNVKLSQLTDKDLYKLFKKFMKELNAYSSLYTKTEAVRLKRFENKKNLIKILHQVGQVRLKMRKAGEPVFYFVLGRVLKEIANRFHLAVKELYFYNYDELEALFKGRGTNKRVLLARKKGYLLWKMNGQTEILTGKNFVEAWDWVNTRFKAGKSNIIKGTTANKGVVKGTVRLIIHRTRDISKQIAKFKSGEILVTEMTRPGTILACRKAAAIITDEGGVTCHAAIISRELGIPCIIGAKIATQALKDGDLAEVDATKGIIKVIKRVK